MKILHIAPIGHHAEGIAAVLSKLCPLQQRLGHDVRVVSIFDNDCCLELPFTTINSKAEFTRFINMWSPDIVVFHSHFHLEYVLFSKELKRRKIPYCVQMHGALSKTNCRKNFLLKFFAGVLVLNKILKGASTIIYLNRNEYQNSIVPKINSRCSFLPNGCDIDGQVMIDRNINSLVSIIFIGRISIEHKGLDILLDAIDILDSEKDLHIYIYGNPDDEGVPFLKSHLKNSLIASFEGGIYGEEKKKVMRHADLFILTSRYEGMPMGVLDAWSSGLPCILTEGTNMINDDTESCAYWKVNLEGKHIASTIIQAVKEYKVNPCLYREAAYRESQKYNWANVARNSIAIYEESCSNPSSIQ